MDNYIRPYLVLSSLWLSPACFSFLMQCIFCCISLYHCNNVFFCETCCKCCLSQVTSLIASLNQGFTQRKAEPRQNQANRFEMASYRGALATSPKIATEGGLFSKRCAEDASSFALNDRISFTNSSTGFLWP